MNIGAKMSPFNQYDKQHIEIKFLLFLLFAGFAFLLNNCSDPASLNKETLVRTLVTPSNIAPGEYTYFWDGKTDDEEYVEPGKYYCDLYETTTGDTIQITVLAGGSVSTHTGSLLERISSSIASSIILEYNRPDPFRVKQGTYIYFNLPYSTSIRLSIHTVE